MWCKALVSPPRAEPSQARNVLLFISGASPTRARSVTMFSKFQQLASSMGVVHDQQVSSMQAENATRLLGRLCETRPQPHEFYSTTDAYSTRPTFDMHRTSHLYQKIFIWSPASFCLTFLHFFSEPSGYLFLPDTSAAKCIAIELDFTNNTVNFPALLKKMNIQLLVTQCSFLLILGSWHAKISSLSLKSLSF
jgi:hypothetical protein